jgi:hypothetical protein
MSPVVHAAASPDTTMCESLLKVTDSSPLFTSTATTARLFDETGCLAAGPQTLSDFGVLDRSLEIDVSSRPLPQVVLRIDTVTTMCAPPVRIVEPIGDLDKMRPSRIALDLQLIH